MVEGWGDEGVGLGTEVCLERFDYDHDQTKQSTLHCNVLLCVHWRIRLYPEPWGIFPTFLFLGESAFLMEL